VQFAPAANLLGENGIIVIVVVALVLFGSTQIPKMARSLGSAQKEFKKGLEEGADDSESATPPRVEAAPPAAVTPPAPAAPPVAQAPPPAEGIPGPSS
jgi:sec-independent protein translocase protein TatA